MTTVATIGVYDWTLERFLASLRHTDVELVIDVRQRRGVRGHEYAWANAVRLQAALAGAGIRYSHHKELGPKTELRHLQYHEDDRVGVGQRSRTELAPQFVARYVHEILDQVDLDPLSPSCGPPARRRSSASSATRRRATGRSLPNGSQRSTAPRSCICSHREQMC